MLPIRYAAVMVTAAIYQTCAISGGPMPPAGDGSLHSARWLLSGVLLKLFSVVLLEPAPTLRRSELRNGRGVSEPQIARLQQSAEDILPRRMPAVIWLVSASTTPASYLWTIEPPISRSCYTSTRTFRR